MQSQIGHAVGGVYTVPHSTLSAHSIRPGVPFLFSFYLSMLILRVPPIPPTPGGDSPNTPTLYRLNYDWIEGKTARGWRRESERHPTMESLVEVVL